MPGLITFNLFMILFGFLFAPITLLAPNLLDTLMRPVNNWVELLDNTRMWLETFAWWPF